MFTIYWGVTSVLEESESDDSFPCCEANTDKDDESVEKEELKELSSDVNGKGRSSSPSGGNAVS